MISSKGRGQCALQEILDELNRPFSQAEMPRRIELCGKALEMISMDENPNLWAALREELACNLLELPIGSRAENIDLAIDYFKQVLEVRTCQNHPKEWAMTQNNLATAYRDRMIGDPDENINQAISHYEHALTVRTREADPMRWAMTQHNLAAAYFKRVRENRAGNQEQAIKLLEELLESEIYLEHPQELTSIQHDLSTVYIERILGGRAENIERAIQLCKQSLEVYSQEQFPEFWASLQYNLGNAYRLRIRGDRIENIEQAISYCEQTLKIRTRRGFPDEWAQTQNNLGLCYLTRFHCKQDENIEQAIHHFQEALKVHTRDDYPREWAQVRNNLGNAYRARIRGELSENIKNAIANYKQALEVRTQGKYPEDWAETQNNLADIDPGYASEEDIEQSIQNLLRVLDIYVRDIFPQYWARTHNNLAIMYSNRKRGTRVENVRNAIYHYQQALEVYTPQAFPDRCLYSARALGNLAFDERDWGLARQSYETAFEAQDALMYASFSTASEKAELAEVQNLPPRYAFAHYKTGDIKRALEVLEKGRAQLLRESYEHQRQKLERLRIPEFQHLYDNYIQARDEYRSLQGVADVSSDWEKSLKKLQAAAGLIREEAGKTHPEYRYFLRSLSFEEIQEQAQEKSLVYLIATHAGGLALIVGRQETQAIELPELEQEALQRQIWRPTNEEVERINDHLKRGVVEDEDIRAVSGGYFSMYALRRLLANISKELNRKLFEAWEDTLDKTTRWLWNVCMGRLIVALKESGGSVTLIPAGQLALLPLHAAWTEDSDKGKRLYALDEMNISYAPSAHALWQARLASARPTERILVVDNPDGSLLFSKGEVIAARSAFNSVTQLPGEKATVAAVKTEMQKAHVLHFSTHGRAGWEKPEEAYVKLTGGNLTLVDIFALDLNQARLAVLSACETGIPGLELIDEMIGLPAGMMQAGIPGVVGSLWSVSDRSTSVLMSGFYRFWRKEGKTPQEALRQAQRWLRDSLLESPYYWAAFTYTGV